MANSRGKHDRYEVTSKSMKGINSKDFEPVGAQTDSLARRIRFGMVLGHDEQMSRLGKT